MRQSSKPRVVIALMLLNLLAWPAIEAGAVTLTVLSTADSGATTLRQAIITANSTATADTIEFNISGSGVQTITPLTPLPTITQPLTINGYTQPGASPNTLADASNAIILIQIDGASAGATANGLSICAPNSVVRGLSITRFQQRGVAFGTDSTGASCGAGAANGSSIVGSFLGLAPDGSALGNNRGMFDDSSVVVIGGTLPADRNVISSNAITGIAFSNAGATGSSALGNLIGWDPSASEARGNLRGVSLAGSVGGTTIGTASAPNRIANNGTGVDVSGSASGNTTFANDIGPNTNLGMDLCLTASCPDGLTPNDLNDADSGGNALQNFPVLSAVTRTATGLLVSGSLDRPTSGVLTFTIALYASASCDASGNGEGERFLGTFLFPSASGAVQTFSNVAFPTSIPIPIGSKITATATDQASGNTSEFSACFNLDAAASTFVVTSTADTAGASCAANCTLRQALTAANAHAGADLINFNIAGLGVHTISPASALPTLSEPLTIDGYTQPGSSPNTLAEGSDAAIGIEIDASGAAGLSISASNVTLRGLSIIRAPGRAITISAGDNLVIEGCFVGLRADGTTAAGNTGGIDLLGGVGHRIGGALPAQRNLIVGSPSGFAGVRAANVAVHAVEIDGNLIGTDRSGILARGNGIGIVVSNSATDIRVGLNAPNTLRFNEAGLLVGSTSNGVNAYANHISDSSGIGIDLSALVASGDGVTPNDLNDADSGGNGLQNFPVLSASGRVGDGVHVSGTLDVASVFPSIFTIAIYASANCDSSGNGEGARYLGARAFSLSSPSGQSFDFDLPTTVALPVGTQLTATATDDSGNTSEFSTCRALDTPANFVVTKTADTNDGLCDADCSLREAIVAANAAPGADRISFNIPGAGVKTISIATALPSITAALTIDGYTQPGSAVNTAAVGSNAVILIEVLSAGTQLAFDINADDVSVRGFSLTSLNFPVRIGGTIAANNAVVTGNFIGLRANGAVSGNAAGVDLERGLNAVIGGPALADRNVISASGASFASAGNIDLRGLANCSARIQGNYVGTDLAGAGLSGSGQKNGVLARGATSSVLIGGTTPAQFNRFGGNAAAIAVTSTASGIRVAGNEIGGSSGLGIDLIASGAVGDGVTANDLNDADSGANNLQNFPVLTSFGANAGQLLISGSLDVPTATSNADYTIGVYANASCDPSGNGEGELYLGSATVNLSGNSVANEAFQFAIAATPVANGAISVTATDALGNTSEFSPCLLDTLLRNGFE